MIIKQLPFLSNEPPETNKCKKSDSPNNDSFLEATLEIALNDVRRVVKVESVSPVSSLSSLAYKKTVKSSTSISWNSKEQKSAKLQPFLFEVLS